MSVSSAPRHFLAYVTASDREDYALDFVNFRNMTRRHPGVAKIELYIAVSRVRAFDHSDRRALAGLVDMAGACPWITVQAVIWKGNIGRDFSSVEACLRQLAPAAGPSDLVLIRNRSAGGPHAPRWYGRYVDQYFKFAGTGLVGSTINFAGHPDLPVRGPTTHVQTYAYLSEWRHLQSLAREYPAARCTERLQLIGEGEIGLSQKFLDRGLGISCLHWPEAFFTRERPGAASLPQTDIKRRAHNVPLRYKSYGNPLNPILWAAKQLWLHRLRDRGRQRAIELLAPELVIQDYG